MVYRAAKEERDVKTPNDDDGEMMSIVRDCLVGGVWRDTAADETNVLKNTQEETRNAVDRDAIQ